MATLRGALLRFQGDGGDSRDAGHSSTQPEGSFAQAATKHAWTQQRKHVEKYLQLHTQDVGKAAAYLSQIINPQGVTAVQL